MAELTTAGFGQVERIADQAALTLRYASRAKDRVAAVDTLTKLVAPAEAVLRRDAVTIRSRRMSTHDVWVGRRRSATDASQSYDVLVTDVTILDELLNALIGTEPADLSGPQWSLADRSTAFREAQAAAVEDARSTALGYVAALGGRLGPLLKLDDTSGHGSYAGESVRFAMAAAPRGGPAPDMAELSLEPQPVTVPATCSIAWELLA